MRVLRSEEAWLLGSETQRKVYFARMQTRNDTQPSSLGNSSLACEDRTKGAESATCGPQRGQGLSNTIPGFAVQSWDQTVCARKSEDGANLQFAHNNKCVVEQTPLSHAWSPIVRH